MRLLLDTHVFLWYITGDPRVGARSRDAIQYAEVAYLSVASIWEVTIKYSAGKLELPEPPNPRLVAERERHLIQSLPIDEHSVAHLTTLASHHRDPFDRIIVCQAIEHDLQVVTVDPLLARYPIKILTAS